MKRNVARHGVVCGSIIVKNKVAITAVAGLVAVGLSGTRSAALTIMPTFDSSITGNANSAAIIAGINASITRVEAAVTTNVTDTITFSSVTTGLGSSLTGSYTIPYGTYANALLTKQVLSASDTTAIASLGYVPGVTTTNPVNGSGNVKVGTSLARALQIIDSTGSDATISLNTSIMNLSRTGPQNPSFYDLQAVAGHEIDEVLGIGGPGSTLGGSTTNIGTLDLYRYSAAGVRSYTTSLAQNAYFSINGGVTSLVNFDQNNQGADYADWGNGVINQGAGNNPPQLQDAFGGPGAIVNLGSNELTALDVVGYNLAVVPEPATCGLIAVAAAGLARRRRRA